MLEVRLIGAFAVSRDGTELDRTHLGSRKGRELLKLLAVERGRTVSVDRIADVLWPDEPPARPGAGVATLVSRLRRALGGQLIDGDQDGYRLGAPPAIQVDLDDAARWVREGELRLAAGEPALSVAAAQRAGDLLSADDVLVDEPAADWAEPARTEFTELRRRFVHLLAEAALATGDTALAVKASGEAIRTDRYDEPARRALMRAHLAAAEPARALAAYVDLRDLLAEELGTDPSPETRELYVAALREESPEAAPRPPQVAPASASDTIGLVGRGEQLRDLRAAWNAAAGGTPNLVLVVGEAGIGKTRLVDELVGIAASTGGTILAARCYAAERSLFLQPVIEAVATAVRTLPPAELLQIAGDLAPALARLLPDATVVLGPAPVRRESPDFERRRAFEAITTLVKGLAERAPVLLALDDLQNAGRSTVELLHFLRRQIPRGRLMVVGTARVEEETGVLDPLADVATRMILGPLPPGAVASLAAAAGHSGQADNIVQRTRGHALFVVETLRALVAGTEGIPESLEEAVLDRVRRAGRGVDEVLRAGAVLGVSFDPAIVAKLLDEPLREVINGCRDALTARLLLVAGRDYEFANDLVREVLYATTPEPANRAYHRLAADLLTDQPEAVALHAAAAEDWPRAARAWLRAGEQALGRAAATDAIELLTHSLEVSDKIGHLDIRARALLARGRAEAAEARYQSALSDIQAAAAAAREAGDQRLEILALRALGGEAPLALGRPVAESVRHLERGLVLATARSDRAMEADLQAWLAVLSANDMRFEEAVDRSRLAVVAARASGSEEALAAALDGQKTSLAYLGEIEPLERVLDELEPLLRRLGDHFRLPWTVFESAFPAVACADWTTAQARIEAAHEITIRGGWSAYAPWHIAHLGWLARLTGRYDEALRLGQAAVDSSYELPHLWCSVTTAALYGATLLEVGNVDAATEVLETSGSLARQQGAAAYLLRALCPLAEATGSHELLIEADTLLRGITAPPGAAFLAGDACYLAVARAWLGHDEPERARTALAPLLDAAARVPWVAALADASLVDGRAAIRLGRADEAREVLRRAAALAQRHGLPRIAREAQATLEGVPD